MLELKKLNILDNSYSDFNIYEELFVCSNRLLNTNHIFKTQDGWAPLVVRRTNDDRQLPVIWLSAKTDNDEDTYIELISGNTQKFFENEFNFEVTENGFLISLGSQVICEAGDAQSNSLEIFSLDLRPLGLNIYGSHNKLNIGSSQMSRNTSSNSDCMFGI
ncbi:hypothetical protein L4C44_01970 [Vibrio satsumensis]|uniref:hypothetical protein n=1 Tax=Vibrio satsumensis TaxID=2910245 RepID=UPI003D0ECEFE